MPDHQQAAIEAGGEALRKHWRDMSTNCSGDRQKMLAEHAIAAAEPHLRRKWAEEIREIATPRTENNTTPAHWMTVAGMAEMKARMISFLEGAGQ